MQTRHESETPGDVHRGLHGADAEDDRGYRKDRKPGEVPGVYAEEQGRYRPDILRIQPVVILLGIHTRGSPIMHILPRLAVQPALAKESLKNEIYNRVEKMVSL